MSLALPDVTQVIPDGQPSTASETSFSQYAHKPLQHADEIRLLCIEPGSWESDLQCTLCHHRLPECPPFEALSYVWGSEEKPCKIGCRGSGALAVTRNCFAAIKRLRRLGSLVVWIDAVCIDQENDLERGHQVKNMPGIYKTAAKVLVYLGEAEDHGDEAMEILRFYKWFQPNHPDMMVPLWKLMQRSWFERIWVLQEVNKARSVAVICGDHVIPWDPCFRLLVKWGSKSFVTKEIPYTLHMRDRDRNTLQPLNLLDLMVNTRFHHCTDPRDRIFALLSMSSEDSCRGIEPDYTATVEEVYTRAATHFLSRIGLNLLAMVDHGHRGVCKLPSWVPDWSRRPTCTPITELTDRYSSLTLEDYSLSQVSTLRIGGKSVGAINDLGKVFEPDNSGWDKACIVDWGRVLAKWHPYADSASLDPVLHMSELSKYDLLESLKTGFRFLSLSAAQTLRGISEGRGWYQSTRNTIFHWHDRELLCSDKFLRRLSDSQFDRQTALEILAGCSSELFKACMELLEMRFQPVSYPQLINHLKNALINEIHQWDFYKNRPPDGTPHFPRFPLAVRMLREFGKFSTHPDLMDSIEPASSSNTRFPDIESHAAWIHERPIMNEVTDAEHRVHQAITSFIRIRFSLEFSQVFPSVERLDEGISTYNPSDGLYWGPYDLFSQIMDQNLSLSEKEKSLTELSLQERIEKLNSTSTKRISKCCKGRRLFVDDQVAGLVPASAQRGDLIFLVGGSKFPLVLREVNGHYILVGACYVVSNVELRARPYQDLTIV